jgi:hypothetical protein
MSDIDPKNPRRDPELVRKLDEQVRQLEYLKGMAKAPMGWPGPLPSSRMIDPRTLSKCSKTTPNNRYKTPSSFDAT